MDHPKTTKPRLAVFRSNKHIYGQIIDDATGKTLLGLNDLKPKKSDTKKKKTKVESAFEVGRSLGEESLKKGIESVVFDRRTFRYHGRVKALADGAREGGLKF